jgi:hypothetical protein
MTKPQITAILMLLSTLEGWALASNHPIPKPIGDSLEKVLKTLTEELLDDKPNGNT